MILLEDFLEGVLGNVPLALDMQLLHRRQLLGDVSLFAAKPLQRFAGHLCLSLGYVPPRSLRNGEHQDHERYGQANTDEREVPPIEVHSRGEAD